MNPSPNPKKPHVTWYHGRWTQWSFHPQSGLLAWPFPDYQSRTIRGLSKEVNTYREAHRG